MQQPKCQTVGTFKKTMAPEESENKFSCCNLNGTSYFIGTKQFIIYFWNQISNNNFKVYYILIYFKIILYNV